MALPLVMMSRMQTRLSQKIGFMILFSVATIAVFFRILRSISALYWSLSYTILYCMLEIAVTIIVSCIPVYRALFNTTGQAKSERYLEKGSRAQCGGQVPPSNRPSQIMLLSQHRLPSESYSSEEMLRGNQDFDETSEIQPFSPIYRASSMEHF